MQAAVGIYINERHDPGDIFKTLYHLTVFAGIAHEVVLLCDTLSPETAAHLKSLPVAAIDDAGGRGRPFFFNALIARKAGLYFFLDAGVLVTEGCLAGLAEILAASPCNGLVGPTMNNCGKYQVDFPCHDTLQVESAGCGGKMSEQGGEAAEDTAPLFGISEAFLAVKGAAVKAVGPADIRYGRGYCWEMDYTARTVCAGFKVLRGKGLFAHLATGPVAGERERSFIRNKQYYQQKFCLRRLQREASIYCAHCLGADCPDFVPRALPYGTSSFGAVPMISCIMPTRDRPEYVQQALYYFERQDYSAREMIVLYEKPEDLPASMPDSSSIRLVKTPLDGSIGEKRNRGCALARGELIAQWDDDDWYAPDRLSRQAAPIIAGKADISGLCNAGFYVVDSGQYWKCTPELFERMFVEGVLGGTLVYRKKIWGGAVRYPDTSLREDADFMVLAQRHGARLLKVDGDGLYAYVRHGHNSWQFAAGNFLDASGWTSLPSPAFLGEDLGFYLGRQASPHAIIQADRTAAARSLPKVSCIMPTADRPDFFQRAFDIYLGQNYPNKELIVVDDGACKVSHLCNGQGIVYLALQRRASIGAKRNIACEQASGEIIVHLDDDDWYAKDWITNQVVHLLAEKAEVTGLDDLLFYDSNRREAWRYSYPAASRSWVHGATLCYRKEFWQSFPFPDIDVGEDCSFLWRRGAKGIVPHGCSDGYIGHIHGGNSSPKQTGDACWSMISDPEILQRIEQAMSGSRIHAPFFSCSAARTSALAAERLLTGD
ncbi:MAG: glycosyltransferase family 2 protein [Desulfurivibrio sp.]|nr:glycosyltransferase family 2 protein [Desulfurivibrio sp.]